MQVSFLLVFERSLRGFNRDLPVGTVPVVSILAVLIVITFAVKFLYSLAQVAPYAI